MNIRPACVDLDLQDQSQEVELYVSGWGTTSAEGKFLLLKHQNSFFINSPFLLLKK